MVDREKELLKKDGSEDIVVNDDFVREDARILPGEEIDPDSIRPVPPIDEEGEIVTPIIEDEPIGEY